MHYCQTKLRVFVNESLPDPTPHGYGMNGDAETRKERGIRILEVLESYSLEVFQSGSLEVFKSGSLADFRSVSLEN